MAINQMQPVYPDFNFSAQSEAIMESSCNSLDITMHHFWNVTYRH